MTEKRKIFNQDIIFTSDEIITGLIDDAIASTDKLLDKKENQRLTVTQYLSEYLDDKKIDLSDVITLFNSDPENLYVYLFLNILANEIKKIENEVGDWQISSNYFTVSNKKVLYNNLDVPKDNFLIAYRKSEFLCSGSSTNIILATSNIENILNCFMAISFINFENNAIGWSYVEKFEDINIFFYDTRKKEIYDEEMYKVESLY